MTAIVIDGLNEEDFRRSIESRLRESSADAAIERLRALLAPYAGAGRVLPDRFLTVEAVDLVLSGWNALGDSVSQHDRPGRPVTAISIAFGWPGEQGPEPDAEGRFQPHIETSYFTDDAFPFSRCAREDLLEGYSYYGCNWAGDSEATDSALSLDGIDDLFGALAELEARLLASAEPDEEDLRAGSLGSCLLSALLFQAVSEQIGRVGLPRPLCVTAGSNGVYPYFDAPVAGMSEEARQAAEAQAAVVEAGQVIPEPRYSSLLMTGIPRAKKRAVLVLDESEDGEIRSEATDAALVPARFDPLGSAAGDGPLLVKKPDRKARDLPEMPGSPDPKLSATEPEPCNRIDQSEPTLVPSNDAAIPRPGFTLLAPVPAQPLPRLPSTKAPSLAEAREPAVPADRHSPAGNLGRVEDDHSAILPDAATAQEIAPRSHPGLRSRLRASLSREGLRRLGHASSAVIALFRVTRRGKSRDQKSRKRGIQAR